MRSKMETNKEQNNPFFYFGRDEKTRNEERVIMRWSRIIKRKQL